MTTFRLSGRAPGAPVAAVILYEGGAALLQHRDDNPEIRWPGYWSLFGGHVEPGEHPVDAARREIEEELELRLEGPLTLVYHGDDGDRTRFVFAAALPVPPAKLRLHEGQGMALLRPEEWSRHPVVPKHRAILEHFRRAYPHLASSSRR